MDQEILIRLKSAFKLDKDSREIVGFEQNLYLKGINYFLIFLIAFYTKRQLKYLIKDLNKIEKQKSLYTLTI